MDDIPKESDRKLYCKRLRENLPIVLDLHQFCLTRNSFFGLILARMKKEVWQLKVCFT